MLSALDVATTDTLAEAAPPLVVPHPPVAPQPQWSLATRVAFRFSFIYFTLYVLTTQMLGGLLPFGWVPDLGDSGVMHRIYSWVGAHVLRLGAPIPFAPSGSGDKLVDWVQAFCILLFAAFGAAIWSVVDRRRPDYRALNKWFRLFLRFSLGTTMIGYGMVKWIPLQMSAPGLQRLLEPYGNFSPMGVLWASIGASKSYEMFAGVMELTCGALLFIPQLATLGAMVTFCTAVQIFMLNMTYDVPVKLFSFHLILMSLVLIAPEASRIARVLVFNRTAGPSEQPPLFRRRWLALAALALQLGYGGYIILDAYGGASQAWWQRGADAAKSPLYGIWDIDAMTIDGQTRTPLVTDYGRWRRVLFPFPTVMTFQRMDDSFLAYGAKVDVPAKTIAVTTGPKAQPSIVKFVQPDPRRLILDGALGGHIIHMEARLVDHRKFLLPSRGFNWIQEFPFNR